MTNQELTDWEEFCLKCFNCDPLEECLQWEPFEIALKERNFIKYIMALLILDREWGEERANEEMRIFCDHCINDDDMEWILNFSPVSARLEYRQAQQFGIVKSLELTGLEQGKDFIVDDGVLIDRDAAAALDANVFWQLKNSFTGVKVTTGKIS